MAKISRILLKLSGEALLSEDSPISAKVVHHITNEVACIVQLGIEVAIVIGGGNIIRGHLISGQMGIDRVTGDYMGMLATVLNGMALHAALVDHGVASRLQTALNLEQVAAPYIREKANRHLDNKRVMIFAGGTGNPYFTTDTAAALRASEVNAQLLIKATNVNGIYSADPALNPDAVCYKTISMDEAIQKRLNVMDATALTLCRERRLPVVVFNLMNPGALTRIVQGHSEGTYVSL